MNAATKLRESIRGRTDAFVASDFDTNKAVGILRKMHVGGEIEITGYDMDSNGKPVKRYKIVRLHEYKVRRVPMGAHNDKRVSDKPLHVQPWSRVYPDLFREPDFSGYAHTVRRVVGC